MYKVFFNDRVIHLVPEIKNYSLDNKSVFHVSTKEEAIKYWKMFLNEKLMLEMDLILDMPDDIGNTFFSLFTLIDAAGGIVTNVQGQLLCILRWGKWDLPKGKKENNEIPEDTAIREVEEECGITGLEITGFNTFTFHIYQHPKRPGEWILKRTYWFNMTYRGKEIPSPQIQEDITEAKWFAKEDLDEVINNSYSSLIPIFETFVSSE